jgi:uncharacterized membrane protein HdeD (DUF308 family)
MLQALARNWWIFLVRGILALLFGILALVWPGPTLEALILLFGAFVLVDGVFELIHAITRRSSEPWWLDLIQGILGIGVGVLTFVWPNVTGLVLLTFIAVWMILIGVFGILAAIRLRRVIEGEWLLGLNALISLLLGILLIVFPVSGALAVSWLIGIYAVLFGILLIALSLRLRKLRRTTRV